MPATSCFVHGRFFLLADEIPRELSVPVRLERGHHSIHLPAHPPQLEGIPGSQFAYDQVPYFEGESIESDFRHISFRQLSNFQRHCFKGRWGVCVLGMTTRYIYHSTLPYTIDIELGAQQLLGLKNPVYRALSYRVGSRYCPPTVTVAKRTKFSNEEEEDLPSIRTRKFSTHKRPLHSLPCPSLIIVQTYKKKKVNVSHQQWKRKILRDWFLSRASTAQGPYPSECEKRELAKLAQITFKQVETFFINGRRSDRRLWTKQDRRCHAKAKVGAANVNQGWIEGMNVRIKLIY